MTTQEVQATTAHYNREDIIKARYQIEFGFIDLARLLKECRDNAYWKILGSDSFEAYLADPDLSFRRSTAYNLIALYERYIDKMGCDPKMLAEIGSSKLTVIAPVVETDPERWLGEARGLGKFDLENEVREEQGKPEREFKRGSYSPSPLPYKSLWDYMERAGCCVCGNAFVEKSHWPTSRGAGADEDEFVPMCHSCHAELHQVGIDTFNSRYIGKIGAWIYARLFALWGAQKESK